MAVVRRRGRLARSISIAAALATGAAVVLSPGTAASASDRQTSASDRQECRNLSKTIDHPALGTLTSVSLTICVLSNLGSKRSAVVNDIWWNTSGWHSTPHLYDDFIFQIRLERNNNTKVTTTCRFTGLVNNHRFTQPDDRNRCTPSSWYTTGLRGNWTADGRLIYDFNRDGQGNFRWAWQGTPSIR